MVTELGETTKNFCHYCKNELINEREIALQAHQICLDEIKIYEKEHEITKCFAEPDAKFLLELYASLGIPFTKTDFSGKRPLTLIGRIVHSHQKPTIEIEVFHKKIISLHVSGTEISSIPESIKEITTLKRLWLYNNKFVVFPIEICYLPNLEELLLDGNLLTSIPNEIGNLKALKILDLAGNNDLALCIEVDKRALFHRGNKIERLPETICNLINLEVLKLHRNALIKLPESIGNLTKLKELTLTANKLKELPDSFTNLLKLSNLTLDHNSLEILPEEIGKMINIKSISIINNALKILPGSICNLKNLKELNLGFYESWNLKSNLPSLHKIQHNMIQELPKNFKNLKALKELDLTFNEFESFPDVVFQLPSLKKLRISWNKIDKIPEKSKKFFPSSNPEYENSYYYGNSIRCNKSRK